VAIYGGHRRGRRAHLKLIHPWPGRTTIGSTLFRCAATSTRRRRRR
jgi:hypothetical protein